MSDDNSEEEMLRQEIADLKKKLVISEETRERNLQDSIRERNSVINKYQDEINRVSAEKDDEIRILSKANELFRAEVWENRGVPRRKGHEIPMPRQVLFDGKTSWESFVKPFRVYKNLAVGMKMNVYSVFKVVSEERLLSLPSTRRHQKPQHHIVN